MKMLEVRDKATRQRLGEIAIAQAGDVARAVERGATAFAQWSGVPVVERP